MTKYTINGWYGKEYEMTAEELNTKIQEDSKSNYNWIASATELTRVCNELDFPKEYANNIKVAILNCFASLGMNGSGGHQEPTNTEAVYSCYNSLDGTDEIAVSAKENYLKMIIHKSTINDDSMFKIFMSDCSGREFRSYWEGEQFNKLSKRKHINFKSVLEGLKNDYNQRKEELKSQCPFKKDFSKEEKKIVGTPLTYGSKFNFGDEIYLIRTKPVEMKCNVCNGDCVIEHPVDKVNIKCPYCHGTGKLTVDNAQMWYVIDEPFKIEEIRIKATSRDNCTIKYKVGQSFGKRYNPAEMNIFATKELAQSECDNRNRPTKRIDLKDIIITTDYANTMPSSDKIKSCYDNYKNTGNLGKDIIVDKNNVLRDGYIGYLVYKMLGKENIKVVIN